ncbi:hypothetical protein C8F01DRAFT_1257863 [Mycena amicta]|nr:hypothetical protein C8F01DRAFT_1257863 [Mycena amicta]
MAPDVALTEVLLLASSWLNVALYTLELVLSYSYLRRRSRRGFYRICVYAMLLFDTICTLDICVNLCLFFLQVPGFAALLVPTVVSIFMTYATAAVEQTVMCYIFYILTRNIFITALLAILILAHLSLALTSGILILALKTEMTIALRITRWADSNSFGFAGTLLILYAGLVVASNTLLMMGLLLKGSPAFSFFFSCQGRIYALALLGNFLVGIPFRNPTSSEDDTGANRRAGPELDLSRSMGLVFGSTRTDGDARTRARTQSQRRELALRPTDREHRDDEQEKSDSPVRLRVLEGGVCATQVFGVSSSIRGGDRRKLGVSQVVSGSCPFLDGVRVDHRQTRLFVSRACTLVEARI